MRSINARAVVLTCLVAVISVAITAAVALPVAVRAATEQTRQALADLAWVAAATTGTNQQTRVTKALADQGITTVYIEGGRAQVEGLPASLVSRVAGGASVSQRVLYQGRLSLVEGRPASAGDGIVLIESAQTITARAVISRLWVALLAGLAAGLLLGSLLARRLVAPLRQVAGTARRISGGDRGARAPTDAPTEVADVSHALNDLVDALAASEGRQRRFLTSISHELRTPLTTIKGYAEALADKVVEPADTPRVGRTMLAESEHLDRLVGDLLALARLEADDFPLNLAPVDLAALAHDVQETWGPRIGLALVVPFAPIWVTTDAGRVRQIIDGLLANAARVVPPDAPVILDVRAESASAVLEVRDGGPGFTDADLAVVFEQGALAARYQGTRTVGSGLGLALAARLATRLGGRLTAGHAPEGGARFTLTLPSGA